MQLYKHLFFDLDHTLWDFNSNEKQTLSELFHRYHLNKYFNDFDDFYSKYNPINAELWERYRNEEVRKQEVSVGRFHQTFLTSGLDDYVRAYKFAKDFLAENSRKTALIPFALEVLEYLYPRYSLYIITNGFIEAQYIKLENSGLRPYFKKVFISEELGVKKPNRIFFESVISRSNAKKKESLIIGDSLENDIAGAKGFGLDHIYFNPMAKPHKEHVFIEIRSLRELLDWL